MNTHTFDNGILVCESHLLDVQKIRYSKRNVHEEDEEDVFTDIIRSLPHGGCFLNVGTAIGYYPLLAKKLRPDLRIHCFEPLPRHVAFFRDNMKLNGVCEDDFSIHQVAISTAPGRSCFKDESYSSSLVRGAEGPLVMEVETIAMNDIFERIQASEVDFLQMDIQGHEAPVLEAFFSGERGPTGLIRSFLIGTHGCPIHDRCRNVLQDNGYIMQIDVPKPSNQPDGILYGELKH